ncbi:MAG: modification methylase, partial [Alistipes sp.]|nr:modification methylase [Alistipes sp.]
MNNSALTAARAAKKDEFYTQLSDIERELAHYKEHFKGKTVLC